MPADKREPELLFHLSLVRVIKIRAKMKEIWLTKGKIAVVDDEDYAYLMQYKWSAVRGKQGNFYASRGITRGRNYVYTHRIILMHREVMDCPDDMQVDHIDGNGLNNQKSNLRIWSNLQNCWNGRRRSRIFPFKGLYNKRWSTGCSIIAYIQVKDKRLRLGSFQTPEEGARAYDIAAMKFFGEYAKTNFPREGYKDVDIEAEFDLLMERKEKKWNKGLTKENDPRIASMAKKKADRSKGNGIK